METEPEDHCGACGCTLTDDDPSDTLCHSCAILTRCGLCNGAHPGGGICPACDERVSIDEEAFQDRRTALIKAGHTEECAGPLAYHKNYWCACGLIPDTRPEAPDAQ